MVYKSFFEPAYAVETSLIGAGSNEVFSGLEGSASAKDVLAGETSDVEDVLFKFEEKATIASKRNNVSSIEFRMAG